ncbi:MAG: hypothetical protein WCW14_01415 [Candidatus Paceibacterota bacterium]|jgi:hypothetical protein
MWYSIGLVLFGFFSGWIVFHLIRGRRFIGELCNVLSILPLAMTCTLAVALNVSDGTLFTALGAALFSSWLFAGNDPEYTIAKLIDHKGPHFLFWFVVGLVAGIYLSEKWFAGYSTIFHILGAGGVSLIPSLIGIWKGFLALMFTLFVIGGTITCFLIITGWSEGVVEDREYEYR